FDRLHSVGEDGHAVETLLAMPDGTVPDLVELLGRESVVGALDFLQTGDGRSPFLEPFDEPRQTRPNAVDVERGDSQGVIPPNGAVALDAEARTASAAGGRLGILDLERCAAQRFDEIDRTALDK